MDLSGLSSFGCQTDGFTFDLQTQLNDCGQLINCKVTRSCDHKTSPNHHPSPTVLDSCYEVFVLMCCILLSLNMVLCIMTKDLHFGIVCPKGTAPLFCCAQT